MTMKTLVLLCLSLAVALGIPVLQDLSKANQSPLVGERLPEQGHVVVENPAPQAVPSPGEHQDKEAPVKMKQTEETAEVEGEVKPEVKEDQELKAEVKLEPEVKVEEADEEDQELKAEVKLEPEVKVEEADEEDHELKAEVKLEPEVKVEEEGMAEQGGQVEEEAEPQQEVVVEKEEEDAKMKVEERFVAGEEGESQPAEVDAEMMEPEVQAEPDFKVESEVKVEPDAQMELEPEEELLLAEAQEEPEVQMSLEGEIYPDQAMEEMQLDAEGKYESMDEPHMELEPLDDDLLEDEARQDAAFQRQDPEALSLEDEEFMSERAVLDEGTVMEMEPEMLEEPLQYQDDVPDAADLEEEAALDMAGQQMALSENYFPEEAAGMEMRYEKQEDSAEEEEYMMMLEEAKEEVKEEEDNLEGRRCPGVLLEDKCYQYFKAPKSAADAEYFCQWVFPKGHLASIANYRIHREVKNLILKENGNYTRTWVGGIRYLNTNRFVWLDGSHWRYNDWLSGEPVSTSGVEACVELHSLGKGKFNDFSCWEPQPFICSYSYQ